MSIENNLNNIHTKIEEAKKRSDQPNRDVQLVVVSKNHSLEEIDRVHHSGIRIFGENRVQELLDKIEGNSHSDIEWHLIGHLQSNKVRQIIAHVTLIHSLDSLSLAKEIEKRAAKDSRQVQALLQVNMAQEAQKYGMPEEEVQPFLDNLHQFPHLMIKGLMFIAPNAADKEDVRPYFKRMKKLFDALKELNHPQVEMRWLSMGMSHDFVEAIEEGSNMVRIGSAVFTEGDEG